MVNTKLAVLRVDVSRETGEVMIFMETACGFRPVSGWPDVNNMQDFANTLWGICSHIDSRPSSENSEVFITT